MFCAFILVVKTTVLLADINDFNDVNDIYRQCKYCKNVFKNVYIKPSSFFAEKQNQTINVQ